ncbi:MAG TPA: fatty acid--CoA ligase family protein [Steroidobacteraceae bacterium]|nr:fatty acid--CoA ligase family protein [Steroidobacteraceae bacterium]
MAVRDPLQAALAMLELDGVAARMVLCPAALDPAQIPHVIREGGTDSAIVDRADSLDGIEGIDRRVTIDPGQLRASSSPQVSSAPTEWILLTSGTTSAPKLVRHRLATLTHALAAPRPQEEPVVWGTFYDIRRYGGLQIFLRAVLQGSLVLADPAEPVPAFLDRARAAHLTHISGTPSHWRKALMSGAADRIAPRYVRLSGEIADQAVLNALRAAYPQAVVAHAFASTEAGVGFEVRDGLAGFPADLLDAPDGEVQLRVVDGTLRIRSGDNAEGYLGEDAPAFPRDSAGAVDTGDRIEVRAGRCYFLGRAGGVVNVGGFKVYPEEIEAVINAHPCVRMSLVHARRNAITGALVVADIVLAEEGAGASRPAPEALKRELLQNCRQSLAPYKVPAMIRIVPALEVSASGKLVRPDA